MSESTVTSIFNAILAGAIKSTESSSASAKAEPKPTSVDEIFAQFEEDEGVPYEVTSSAMREASGFIGTLNAVLSGGWTYGAPAVIDSVARAVKDGSVGNLLELNDENISAFKNGVSADTIVACFNKPHSITSIRAKVLILMAEEIHLDEVRVSQAAAIMTCKLSAERIIINHGDVLAPTFQCRTYAAMDDRLYTDTTSSKEDSHYPPSMFSQEAGASMQKLMALLNHQPQAGEQATPGEGQHCGVEAAKPQQNESLGNLLVTLANLTQTILSLAGVHPSAQTPPKQPAAVIEVKAKTEEPQQPADEMEMLEQKAEPVTM